MSHGDKLLDVVDAEVDDYVRRGRGQARGLVRLYQGTVTDVATVTRTCAVAIEGADKPTPGVRYFRDQTAPSIGDVVIVSRDLGSRYLILGRL